MLPSRLSFRDESDDMTLFDRPLMLPIRLPFRDESDDRTLFDKLLMLPSRLPFKDDRDDRTLFDSDLKSTDTVFDRAVLDCEMATGSSDESLF